MKLEVRRINSELTYVGYWSRTYCEYAEITKCFDTDMTGKRRAFYRCDFGGRTFSSLNRTKAEAIERTKKFMKFKKEQDMSARKIRGY